MRTLLLTSLLIPALASACLWDRDTLAQEAKGKLDLIDAIVGRIDRYPAIYYQRRIELAQPKLKLNPNDLGLYDDLAVAYDRLGNSELAIATIQAKRKLLSPSDKEHAYRTEANEGTFWAHRWFAGGRKEEQIHWLSKGRDMIAKALEINPNAHFGRERAQLAVMDWVLKKRGLKNTAPELMDFATGGQKDGKLADELRKGFAGLMVLGNAWESIDIIEAIGSGWTHSTLMDLATLRVEELVAAGKREVLPHYANRSSMTYPGQEDNVKENFALLRRSADEYRTNLTKYIEQQIALGRHPDKDGDTFWDSYTPVPRPTIIPGPRIPTVEDENRRFYIMAAVALTLIAAIVALIAWAAVRYSKRLKARFTRPDDLVPPKIP